MNQKNIFTVIAAFLLLQGISFFFMGSKVSADAFGDLGATGNSAMASIFELVGALSILMSVVTYANRSHPDTVWAFAAGTVVLLIVTFKHKFADHINVPMWAIVSQVLIVLAIGYLWMQNRNKS